MTGPANPQEWVEADTGYRVVRLSQESGSSSLYFNENGFTPQGDFLIISTPKGLSKIEMSTLELSPIIHIDKPFRLLFTGRTHRYAYYETREIVEGVTTKSVMRVNVDGGTAQHITSTTHGEIQSLNCDETLLAGIETDPSDEHPILRFFEDRDVTTDQPKYKGTWPDGREMTHNEAKELRMTQRFEAKVEMKIFVIDVASGERRDIYASRDWLNHLLFSPTDASLLMYCHEGPWHDVDRLWTIRVNVHSARPSIIHERKMFMEIAGHEWFSQDGKIIWYDVQTPRGEDFWVAGYEIATGKRTWYHLERNEWSVHFHTSYDGKLFAGDGGEDWMVARAEDGKWLYLFTPRPMLNTQGHRGPFTLIQPGVFDSIKLVNMKEQDYALEPNVNFSPDGKWLIFRANFHGSVHTYAVDLQRGAKHV